MRNRSVPTDIVLPHVVYENVAVHLGNAYIMLTSARSDSASPAKLGYHTQYLTVFVDDVNVHYEKAKSAGARIVEELNETIYGEREYGVEDLEGHRWLFSQHARDISSDEWGATIGRR